MKRLVVPVLVAALVAAPAHAAVNVVRHGEENPMVEIARSTFYGALAGVLVGSAITVASDSHDATPIKWGFVFGTFIGAGYGFYSVTSRPSAALIEWRDGQLASGGAAAAEASPRGVRVRLAAVRF